MNSKKIRQSIVWILLLLLLAVNVWLARQFPVSAAGEPLTIAAPVVFSAGYTISSAQFIDNANSAYFLDPAATGDSLVAAGKVTAGSFAGDGSALTGISGIPAGLVSFFNLASCPSGWTELTAARGMYIVGLPLSGTLAGTSGTALTNLESRAVGQHLHSVDPASTGVSISDPGHRHNFMVQDGNWTGTDGWQARGIYSTTQGNPQTTSSTTGISASVDIAAFNSANAGSVAGTNAPYIQLLACQKS